MSSWSNCFVPGNMVFDDLLIPSVGDFLAASESAINLPYTAVYLGVGFAVLRAVEENVRQRRPTGLRTAARLSFRHPPSGGEDER